MVRVRSSMHEWRLHRPSRQQQELLQHPGHGPVGPFVPLLPVLTVLAAWWPPCSLPLFQVELPLGATEDRICGTIDIEKALTEGVKAFEPGLLVRHGHRLLAPSEGCLPAAAAGGGGQGCRQGSLQGTVLGVYTCASAQHRKGHPPGCLSKLNPAVAPACLYGHANTIAITAAAAARTPTDTTTTATAVAASAAPQARANRGILYVDEVNLLDDGLVDVVLDSSASGINTVEREGISIAHPAKFIMIGSGNPAVSCDSNRCVAQRRRGGADARRQQASGRGGWQVLLLRCGLHCGWHTPAPGWLCQLQRCCHKNSPGQ